jgi:hypothetical protein
VNGRVQFCVQSSTIARNSTLSTVTSTVPSVSSSGAVVLYLFSFLTYAVHITPESNKLQPHRYAHWEDCILCGMLPRTRTPKFPFVQLTALPVSLYATVSRKATTYNTVAVEYREQRSSRDAQAGKRRLAHTQNAHTSTETQTNTHLDRTPHLYNEHAHTDVRTCSHTYTTNNQAHNGK